MGVIISKIQVYTRLSEVKGSSKPLFTAIIELFWDFCKCICHEGEWMVTFPVKYDSIRKKGGGCPVAGKRQLILRNERMDLYKGVAIYCVIAIHVLFPGSFGTAVRVFSRFAVPFFFLTAGYFNLGATPGELRRRAVRTGFQLVGACIPYLILGIVLTVRRGDALLPWLYTLISPGNIKDFLFYHTIPLPYAWQLWFLGALTMVYLFWWAIATLCVHLKRAMPYDSMAIVSVILLMIHLGLGEGMALAGRTLDNRILRNAMLDGLPFFALGSWWGWRRWDIKSLSVPWHWIMLLGVAVSFAEAYFVGKQELYLGTVILLTGMMGRCIRYRRVLKGKVSAYFKLCGELLTLPIFVIHLLVIAMFREVPALAAVQQMGWILPPVVAVLSTVLAVFWFVGIETLREKRRKYN